MLTLAQQVPNVSYFMYDLTRTNPGSSGSKDMICATAITKQQWTGFPGAPLSLYFNASAPFKLFGGNHGVGLSIYNEEWGFYNDIELRANYAYQFQVGDGSLGVGVTGGFFNKKLEPEWEGENTTTDPGVPQGDQNEMEFLMGAGLFYRSEDIYFGVSGLNLVSPKFEYYSDNTGGGLSSEELVPHVFVTAGYNMQLSNPAYEIQPSVQLYTELSTVTIDVNTTLVYNKKIWGGVSYRTGSSVIGMIGINLFDGLKVGYAYDFPVSALNKETLGSHEVVVNYCFKVGRDRSPQKYKSIRFL